MLWNRYAHGDALHFHTRVSSFWYASGGQRSDALLQVLRGYPLTAIVGVPTLTTIVLGSLWIAYDRKVVASWVRPLAGAGIVVLALTLMQTTGGAPTHHPERTLLLVWMVLWAFAADLIDQRGVADRVPLIRQGLLAVVCTLLAVQLKTSLPIAGADREAEVLVGTWLHQHAGEQTVLVDPVDFGHFAVTAAAGMPSRMKLARSIDPREAKQPSPFEEEAALRAKVSETGARWLVVRKEKGEAARRMGEVRKREGNWEVVEVK